MHGTEGAPYDCGLVVLARVAEVLHRVCRYHNVLVVVLPNFTAWAGLRQMCAVSGLPDNMCYVGLGWK